MSHEIDRQNCERVTALLLNLDYKIKAIWVVKRPINYDEQSKFDHWVLKIQAPPALISIDFLQYNKKVSCVIYVSIYFNIIYTQNSYYML